jgi:hypothetical protein
LIITFIPFECKLSFIIIPYNNVNWTHEYHIRGLLDQSLNNKSSLLTQIRQYVGFNDDIFDIKFIPKTENNCNSSCFVQSNPVQMSSNDEYVLGVVTNSLEVRVIEISIIE